MFAPGVKAAAACAAGGFVFGLVLADGAAKKGRLPDDGVTSFVAGLVMGVLCGGAGWLGVRHDGEEQERQRRRRNGQCPWCGYDLRDNESGVCPECGRRRGRGLHGPV